MSDPRKLLVYVGTYANPSDGGIYWYELDRQTGDLLVPGNVAGIENPSFLAIDEKKHRLYTVSEADTFQGQKGGSVTAFALDPQDGQLTLLNQQPTLGGAPCHLTLDATGAYLLTVNYMGGNINLYPLGDNGEIGAMADNVQHQGQSVNADRQEAPHPHTVVIDPSGTYALVTDLGLDTISIYRVDTTHGKLVRHSEIQEKPGAGPRHLAFHPSGRYLYLINELDSTVSVFAYDAAQGHLQRIQTLPTLPDDFSEESTCADIHVSPSGLFLYGSNRGHDSIVQYAIEPESGLLTFVQHTSTQGKTPRNFMITPDGRFLFAANQDSDSLVLFSIDQIDGKLTPTGKTVYVPKPVCIKTLALH